jgi:hypothetical protein
MTVQQREGAIGMLRGGCTHAEVATHFERGIQTIRDLERKYNTTNTTADKPRSGRSPILSLHQKKIIYRKARAQPKIEYKDLAKAGVFVKADGTASKPPSKATLYRLLARQSLTKYRCKIRPKLTRAHALARLRFAQKWRTFAWHRRTLKFSDECSVQKGSGHNNEWCFRFVWEK